MWLREGLQPPEISPPTFIYTDNTHLTLTCMQVIGLQGTRPVLYIRTQHHNVTLTWQKRHSHAHNTNFVTAASYRIESRGKQTDEFRDRRCKVTVGKITVFYNSGLSSQSHHQAPWRLKQTLTHAHAHAHAERITVPDFPAMSLHICYAPLTWAWVEGDTSVCVFVSMCV